jgi:hypothetical protein
MERHRTHEQAKAKMITCEGHNTAVCMKLQWELLVSYRRVPRRAACNKRKRCHGACSLCIIQCGRRTKLQINIFGGIHARRTLVKLNERSSFRGASIRRSLELLAVDNVRSTGLAGSTRRSGWSRGWRWGWAGLFLHDNVPAGSMNSTVPKELMS